MPIKEEKRKNEILIPLRKLAHSSPYSESYLYRLARAKKIKVVKVSHCFYTTLRWYNDFLAKEKDNKKPPPKITEESKLSSVLAKCLSDEARDRDKIDIDEKLVTDWQNIFKKVTPEILDEIRVTVKSGEKYFYKFYKKLASKLLRYRWLTFLVKQRVESAKQETNERLISRPWIAKLVTICIIALFFSISIGRLTPVTAVKLAEKTDNLMLYPLAKTVQLAGYFNLYTPNLPDRVAALKPVDHNILSAYIASNQDKLADFQANENYVIKVSAKELHGRVAGVAEQAERELAAKSNLSLFEFTKLKSKSLAKKAGVYFKDIFYKLADKQKQFSLGLNNQLVDLITK
jgi:hypothetical protein